MNSHIIAFNLYDTEDSGAIDVDQFAKILKSLKIEKEDDKIQSIIKEVDSNHDGQVDFKEFVTAMTSLLDPNGEPKTSSSSAQNEKKSQNRKSYSRSMSKHETDDLKMCFEKFDSNGDGQISFTELKNLMDGLGDKLTEQELKDMMTDADTNKDGFIDFEEFKALKPKDTPKVEPKEESKDEQKKESTDEQKEESKDEQKKESNKDQKEESNEDKEEPKKEKSDEESKDNDKEQK